MRGWRHVPQRDGTVKVYRPDGRYDGIARKLPNGRFVMLESRGAFPQAPRTRRAESARPQQRTPVAAGGKQTTTSARPTSRHVAPPSTGRYVVIASLRVDDDVRRAAQEAADSCADDLGITRRSISWFDEATPFRLLEAEMHGKRPERFDSDDCLGIFRPEAPNRVYIKITDSPLLAAEVAAHETRHRWQHTAWGRPTGPTDEATYEDDARRYGEAYRGGTPW